eukprot:c12676_g1_i1.p1 GENE.c12676_g1_i1~~c12676_g1_i1.p1  ORF type:complete len:2014 (+),score=463.34 c12676_g1_i1:423-6044(+)
MKVNMTANFLAAIHENFTHHTVVSVNDVTFGGFALSPMVLFDKTGPVCELYDNFLGCPIQKGPLNLARKIKIPGLDAISSLPKRLYDAKIVLSDDSTLVTCVHLLLDMRPSADQLASPVTGVTVIAPVTDAPLSVAPITPTAINTNNNDNNAPSAVARPTRTESLLANSVPVLSNIQTNQQTISQAAPQQVVSAQATQPRVVTQIGTMQAVPQVMEEHGGNSMETAESDPLTNTNAGTTPTEIVAPSHDTQPTALNVLRGIINMQEQAKSSSSHSDKSQDDTVLLQQLQLRNLQEQLVHQKQINVQQQAEYDQLKQQLQRLDPAEVAQLKETVSQLLLVQRQKEEQVHREQEAQQKEKVLLDQLTRLYRSYNLPLGTILPPFAQTQALLPQPVLPQQNSHALSQLGGVSNPMAMNLGAGIGAPQSALSALLPKLIKQTKSTQQSHAGKLQAPDIQNLVELEKLVVPDASLELDDQSQAQSLVQNDKQSSKELPRETAPAAAAEMMNAPIEDINNGEGSTNGANTGGEKQGAMSFAALGDTPTDIAGEYANSVQPLQLPNPNNPSLQYSDQAKRSGGVTSPQSREEEAEAVSNTPPPQGTVVSVQEDEEAKLQDADLPDLTNVLVSTPTFSDNQYGVSYVLSELDPYIADLCVPFVTLGSDLSFAFCVPHHWQGTDAAIVITEPFTAEKGFFADKTSITSPVQGKAMNNSDEQYYALPKYTGLNELLIKHKFATLVVTFNADSFIENLNFYTTEIMGAYAAFVDYAGEPSNTIVSGVGWAGVIAAQLLERHGGCRLKGGLVLDSPLGSARWQGDYYGDVLSLFEWISPRAYATITSTRYGALSHLLLESWEEIGRPYVYQALTPYMNLNAVANNFTSPRDLKMIEMLHALDIKCSYKHKTDKFDEPHPQCLYEEVAGAVRKAALYIMSYRLAFNGQDPFDNYRTLYVPEAFPHLNELVKRKMADEAALNHQTRYLETTGLLRVPLMLLQTQDDPEVPEWQGVEYLRKQKQVCENNGVGIRVINDTMNGYYGHAHADDFGTMLSQEIDILRSVMDHVRTVDSSALSQRQWNKAPLKMVDPDLSACPSQVEWYLDMLAGLKRAIKSGTLRTNNMIKALVGEAPAPPSPIVSRIVSSDSARVATAAAEAVANGASDVIKSLNGPAAQQAVGQVYGAGGQVAGGAAQAVGGVGAASQGAVSGVAKGLGGAVGGVTGALVPQNVHAAQQAALADSNAFISRLQSVRDAMATSTENQNSNNNKDTGEVIVPSYSELAAVPQNGSPSQATKYQKFLERLAKQPSSLPALPRQPQAQSWTEALAYPVSSALSAFNVRRASVGPYIASPTSRLANYFYRGLGRPSPNTALLELAEGAEYSMPRTDAVIDDKPINDAIMVQSQQQVQREGQAEVMDYSHAQGTPINANNIQASAAQTQPQPPTNAPVLSPDLTNIIAGAQSALSAFNKARHTKLPISVFKPFSIATALGASSQVTADANDLSFVDKLGLAVERRIEQKLGLDPSSQTNAQATGGDTNMFPVGKAYAAALAEKGVVLDQLHVVPRLPSRSSPSTVAAQPAAPATQLQPQIQPLQQPQLSVPRPQQPAVVSQPQQQFGLPEQMAPRYMSQQSAPMPMYNNAVPQSGAFSTQGVAAPPATAAPVTVIIAPSNNPGLISQISSAFTNVLPAVSTPVADFAETRKTLDKALGAFAVNFANLAVDKVVSKITGKHPLTQSTEVASATLTAQQNAQQNKMQLGAGLQDDGLGLSKKLQRSFDAKVTQEASSFADKVMHNVGHKFGTYSESLLRSVFKVPTLPGVAVGLTARDDSAQRAMVGGTDSQGSGLLADSRSSLQQVQSVASNLGETPKTMQEAFDERVVGWIHPAV